MLSNSHALFYFLLTANLQTCWDFQLRNLWHRKINLCNITYNLPNADSRFYSTLWADLPPTVTHSNTGEKMCRPEVTTMQLTGQVSFQLQMQQEHVGCSTAIPACSETASGCAWVVSSSPACDSVKSSRSPLSPLNQSSNWHWICVWTLHSGGALKQPPFLLENSMFFCIFHNNCLINFHRVF